MDMLKTQIIKAITITSQIIFNQQEDILDELKYLNDSNDVDRQEQEDYTEPNDYQDL